MRQASVRLSKVDHSWTSGLHLLWFARIQGEPELSGLGDGWAWGEHRGPRIGTEVFEDTRNKQETTENQDEDERPRLDGRNQFVRRWEEWEKKDGGGVR